MKYTVTTKAIASIMALGALTAGLVSAQSIVATGSSSTNTKQSFANLTDAQKKVLEESRALFEAGKKDEAKTLLTNAGITLPERGMKGGHMNMKKLDDAIILGDYAAFKTAAVNSPLASISESVFVSLKAPMIAKRDAETQIQNILTQAGITFGNKVGKKAD